MQPTAIAVGITCLILVNLGAAAPAAQRPVLVAAAPRGALPEPVGRR